MRIEPFKVEEWMNSYEVGAKYNIAETCVDSISIDELFHLTGKDRAAFLDEICSRRLTYGDIEGAASFREGAQEQIIDGRAPGRTDRDEITVFDSTGIALQDLACAALALSKAERENLGTTVEL
ncbi:hypothetical protein [Dethiosulfovibrio salsuginis]|uniref:Ornithine cyclodeaminase/mu-crystallin family protein n=1 Tax=Dethiosulfovibrio salsuginis TaxID=561720 RepID=A0A1X7IFD1_9BACT|nr:hypothetical protein [Dethiosulfovibrio salsuginis]SMG13482.1 Ornithine cyclodeaminase/mu-crystallin family protein [Dethiosulfovibrio salsuginis]